MSALLIPRGIPYKHDGGNALSQIQDAIQPSPQRPNTMSNKIQLVFLAGVCRSLLAKQLPYEQRTGSLNLGFACENVTPCFDTPYMDRYDAKGGNKCQYETDGELFYIVILALTLLAAGAPF